jgi:hypothetical protein
MCVKVCTLTLASLLTYVSVDGKLSNVKLIVMKVFVHVTTCCAGEFDRRFGETHRPKLECREKRYRLSLNVAVGRFLENVVSLLPQYTVLYLGRQFSFCTVSQLRRQFPDCKLLLLGRELPDCMLLLVGRELPDSTVFLVARSYRTARYHN